jgi:protein Tex
VNDAREVVKTGDIVKVKVLEVDVARKRISLTMKLDTKPQAGGGERDNSYRPAGRGERPPGRDNRTSAAPVQASAMEMAFAKLKAGRN